MHLIELGKSRKYTEWTESYKWPKLYTYEPFTIILQNILWMFDTTRFSGKLNVHDKYIEVPTNCELV